MTDHHYRILVVDDEPDICEILQFNLETEGYEAETARTLDQSGGHPGCNQKAQDK